MHKCLPICTYVHYASNWARGQKTALNLLQMELYCLGAGAETWILFKKSKCS